jgi:hypothetical protein
MGNWLFECKSSMDRGTKRKSLFVLVGFAVIIAIFPFISNKSKDKIEFINAIIGRL